MFQPLVFWTRNIEPLRCIEFDSADNLAQVFEEDKASAKAAFEEFYEEFLKNQTPIAQNDMAK